MLKGFEYNKECRKMVDRSEYAEEHRILNDFLSTKNENVRFEYGTEREATNAGQALKNWVKNYRKPLKVAQRREFVFVTKTIDLD